MKQLFSLILSFCSLVAFGQTTATNRNVSKTIPEKTISSPASPVNISISLTCTIARDGCTDGGGLCDCKFSLSTAPRQEENVRKRLMTATVVGKQLELHSMNPFPSDASVFVYEVPTVMDSAIANKLGFKKITIQPGKYIVEKDGKASRILLNVVTK